MKATYLNFKKTFFIVMAATTLLSATANATSTDPKDSTGKATVQYIGTVNSQPVFKLEVNNAAADDLVISLENTEGDVLYKKDVSNEKFSQKIQLQTTDSEIELNLFVYSKKTKKTQAYYINKVTRQVDDLVVNQVKY
jgi:hypothetical protein